MTKQIIPRVNITKDIKTARSALYYLTLLTETGHEKSDRFIELIEIAKKNYQNETFSNADRITLVKGIAMASRSNKDS